MDFIPLIFRLTSQTPELAGALFVSEQKRFKLGMPSHKPAAPHYLCVTIFEIIQ